MKKIFEYDYHFFLLPFGKIWIEEDGSLYKENSNTDFSDLEAPIFIPEQLIFKAPEMINDINSVIEKNHDILSRLPKKFDNPGVLDGAQEKLVLGKWKFEGGNIINAERISNETFESVLKLEKYFRGYFYSAELQKVFREVKGVIDSYNKTGIILWHSEEPPSYFNKYDFSVEKYFSEKELQVQTFHVGDKLPFNPFLSDEKNIILMEIKKKITEYVITYNLGHKHYGYSTKKKGDDVLIDYKYKRMKIPVLYIIEDIDENSISVKLCGIEKEYLKKHQRLFDSKHFVKIER